MREIYESAIEAEPPGGLPDADCLALCSRYAALERQLGEVDRARCVPLTAVDIALHDLLRWLAVCVRVRRMCDKPVC